MTTCDKKHPSVIFHPRRQQTKQHIFLNCPLCSNCFKSIKQYVWKIQFNLSLLKKYCDNIQVHFNCYLFISINTHYQVITKVEILLLHHWLPMFSSLLLIITSSVIHFIAIILFLSIFNPFRKAVITLFLLLL